MRIQIQRTIVTCVAAALATFTIVPGYAGVGTDPAGLQPAARDLISRLLEAWRHADARAMAAQYAPGGDFVSPAGDHAVDRGAIESFYRAAFGHGYAGSNAAASVIHVRSLSQTLMLVDGTWTITPTASSQITESEAGIFVAVLTRRGDRWWISALREQTSASVLREQ
jgi:uncharacterized protein (TIGR02246 family)